LWREDIPVRFPMLASAQRWLRRHLLGDAATAAIECIRTDGDPSAFHMFDCHERAPVVERLPLGAWVGISGAAFGTGRGHLTSVPLSLLAGFFDLRLGYWWDSHIRPSKRPGSTPVAGLVDLA